jgi:methylated-DNA-protein-cysteine methyltransferase-like protein
MWYHQAQLLIADIAVFRSRFTSYAMDNSHSQPIRQHLGASSLYEQIYECVRQIPHGRVTTYGMIGKLVGTHARVIGYALHHLRNVERAAVPWQRVINARGMISTYGNEQRRLLEQEGIVFDAEGRVDFQKYGWP